LVDGPFWGDGGEKKSWREMMVSCKENMGLMFVEFTFITNKVCKVFNGKNLYNVHKSLNVSDGNVEVFKLVDDGVMDDTMNANSKGKKGAMPSVLFNCMKEGGIFGALSVGCLYKEATLQ